MDSCAEEGGRVLEEKAIVNAEDAVQSIRSGMSDEALMEKYELSQKGLQSLFRKLVAAGVIEQSVLNGRRSSLHRPSWILSLRNPPRLANMQAEDVESDAASPNDRSIWKAYKHYFSAVGGALVGGVAVFLGMTFLGEPGQTKSGRSAAMVNPADTAGRGEFEQAEQLIGIFEAIAKDRREKKRFEALGKASDYEDCLNNCSKESRMLEQSDKALLANCRRECMAKYAERIKEIRRRYHQKQDQD
jgi:hypothetical protein